MVTKDALFGAAIGGVLIWCVVLHGKIAKLTIDHEAQSQEIDVVIRDVDVAFENIEEGFKNVVSRLNALERHVDDETHLVCDRSYYGKADSKFKRPFGFVRQAT